MRIINLHYPKDYDLTLFGDNHYGNRLASKTGFEKCLDFINDNKDCHAIHMGDAVDAITWADNRFDLSITKLTPSQERNAMIDILGPIKNKIDVMLLGNHEYACWKYGNLTEEICEALSTETHEVVYGTYTCVVQIYDDDGLQFKMYLTHGFGTIRSNAKDYEQKRGNEFANLKNKLKDQFSDCLIMAMGHTHRLIIVPPADENLYLNTTKDGKITQKYLSLGANSNYISPEERYYINTGSFLKAFDPKPDANGVYPVGYAERAGYKPIDLGFINIEVRDRKIKDVYKVKV